MAAQVVAIPSRSPHRSSPSVRRERPTSMVILARCLLCARASLISPSSSGASPACGSRPRSCGSRSQRLRFRSAPCYQRRMTYVQDSMGIGVPICRRALQLRRTSAGSVRPAVRRRLWRVQASGHQSRKRSAR